MRSPSWLGPGVDRSRIHPDAKIEGAAYLTGERTRVGAGAVVRDARLHNAVVAERAEVFDSIVAEQGEPESHACDAAGRVTVRGSSTPTVAEGAVVRGATLLNTDVGANSRVTETWARDVRLGAGNEVARAKLVLASTGAGVRVHGPTEVSEAWLGDGATLDRRGYFEGVFSNAFRKLAFDPDAKRLRVVDTIRLPHVSRYGTNTINSTNSGRIKPQPGGVLESFGPPRGLWGFGLLSHEQIELGPCCWVAPWTKVIGQSAEAHADDEALVNDWTMTYLMPFAVAGVGGEATNGLVMPGELSVGYGPKKRSGAWAFTYAPDLVIRMVKRLYEALAPERKAVADTIVVEAINTALAMTRALAAAHGVDLGRAVQDQRRGWPRWIGRTHALLRVHRDAGLWTFREGEPVGWRHTPEGWRHPALERVLDLAPDALETQVMESELFDVADPVPPLRVAVPAGELSAGEPAPQVHPEARIAEDAHIGPGCVIDRDSSVGPGARLWRAVLDQASVGRGAVIERSKVSVAHVGADATVRSSDVSRARLAEDASVEAAAIFEAGLAAHAEVSAFADLTRVRTTHPAILGGRFDRADLETTFMSMHLAGHCAELRCRPTEVVVDGEPVRVPAVPMIGGGACIRGTADNPVQVECAFVGSNACLEPGSRIGFGCFVLGRLETDAGLAPFTLATGSSMRQHQLGGVLLAMPNVVITHFLEWAYQCLGAAYAPAVAELVPQSAKRALAAIRAELARRTADEPPPPDPAYRSLSQYAEGQLRAGETAFARILDQRAWELAFRDGELRFVSDAGRWRVEGGQAVWTPAP